MASDPVELIVEQWRERLPTLDTSPLLVVARLMRIAERCESLLRQPFADAGIASGDFDALAALRRSDPPHALTPGELGAAMLVTSGAVSKRIDRLEGAGLVSRSRSADDGRGRVVQLTAEGERLTDRLMRAHMDNERAILSDLSSDEQVRLARLLTSLLISVEDATST